MSPPTVFVCGVTGTQGGAVARNLLSKGASVHALARNPTSPNATTMASLGVKLFPGDYNDEAPVKTAMEGCTAAFLNLSPDLASHDEELRLARSIISIAKAAGVQHFIYTSSPSVNAPEKLTYWDTGSPIAKVLLSKQAIENGTRSAGFEFWTILRPANFMANFIQPLVRMQTGLVEHGRWSNALERSTVLPMVDPDTIGKFACAALLDPVKFNTQEIELADELLVPDQIMEKLSSATGRDLKAVYLSDEEINAQKATNLFVAGQLAMRDIVKFVDMDKIRSWGIPLSSFNAFVERERERVIDTYSKK